MESNILKYFFLLAIISITLNANGQNFSGEATYVSKSKMELGNWGARLSEAQKKQVAARLKNRLEKSYVLKFNKQEATFLEEEKIDAISGATDSWGGYFSRGDQYKNILENKIVQSQEFYGKRFLVKDDLYKIEWTMGSETKKIGNYTCYKAKAFVPYKELNWYNFSWSDIRTNEDDKQEEKMVIVEAWYTPEIPLAHGPAEFWGLPGFILEVSADNTTLLCTEITINRNATLEIEAPDNGKEVTKNEYSLTVREKMLDMRNNRGRRRG
ncbi:GLPGLI family protein [Polaribacter aestuariivivens]|uniref:GLPGLI family protein n=1 Tax=Polaribacter aestuariivivens TaxID=2304626 RepID=A0A5S3NA72_9FLAO|nr:GLPGLI family protein [Polaribacter aestuariivivens]TMM32007.1 GLPGLI family protein [Polaribacter aestuariivivens]